MSIPKEPRQLMINLMYLVLTAMLALSLSAEIFNAFYTLDKGNVNSESIVSASNAQIMKGIEKQVEVYKDKEPFKVKAQQALDIVEDFNSYVAGLRTELVEMSGGQDTVTGHPAGYSDAAATMQLLVEGLEQPGKPKIEPRGAELKAKITATREALFALLDEKDKPNFENAIPLKVEQPPAKAIAKAKAKGTELTWEYFNFNQMPVAAVLPMLSKYQVDAKSSATAILNHFSKKVSGEIIVMDKYDVVVSAPKGYLLEGQKYEANIFLSAYSSQVKGMTIKVGGRNLPVKNGKAAYSETAGSIGTKNKKVTISLTNPFTKKTETYTGKLSYEVGQKSIAVAADKMNVFYVGVDNPITVSAAGIPTSKLRVSAPGLNLRKGSGKSSYIVKPTKPAKSVFINVSGEGESVKKEFRVKRIPTPSATLGRDAKSWKGGTIKSGPFKVQRMLEATLENFDFDAKCSIQGFNMTYVKRREDGVVAVNRGGKFSSEVTRLVSKAKPGDIYYFENVKGRCPGDAIGRSLNSLVFKIR